jgi:hypothetical protein
MREPVECTKCGRPYRADLLKACPRCAGDASIENTTLGNKTTVSAEGTSKVSHHTNFTAQKNFGSSQATRVAIQSAKIVNAYGTYVQVIGIVIGLIIVIGGFILASQNQSIIYGIVGFIVGALDIAIFAVQGALFRMISNYVIARLEQ